MIDLKGRATQMASAVGDLLKGGGAADLLGKLHLSGLGDIASSWVGMGKNLPISFDQITKVLGSGPIAAIAAKLGISPAEATQHLTEALPHAIDHMTPNGQAPAADAAAPDPVALATKLFGGG